MNPLSNKIPLPAFSTNAEHGEGPVWDPIEQRLYWVDILQGKFYKGDPLTQSVETFSVGQPLGVLALRQQGGFVMGVRDGFGFYDDKKNTFQLIEPSPEQHNARVRFNDGAIDPRGRFFAGTMEWDGKEDIGKLFRLDTSHQWKTLEENIFVTNGMGWNNRLTTYFMIDSLRNVVYAYDYDIETGDISNRRPYIQFPPNEFPDGMCLDSEDGFWIALWGGAKIVHYDASGKFIEAIPIPALHPTSCCFGGKDMKTLFITTSRIALSENEKQKYPQAGLTFYLETGTKGKIQGRYMG